MLENLLVVTAQVVTLFLMMGVGFALFKLGRLTKDGIGQMSHILLYVVTPCIVVKSLQTGYDAAMLHNLALGTGIIVASYVACALLVMPFFRKKNLDERAPLQFGSMYSNCSFMGLPLVQAVLGDQALIYAVLAMVAFNVSIWIHGVILMGGKEAASVKKALLNPGVLGLLVGLPLFLMKIRLPSMVGNALGFFSNLNTPMAMLVIGGQMAQADFASTFRKPALYAASALKLLVIPALFTLLLIPLHPDPLMYVTLVILSAAPTAGTTGIFAQRFGRDTATAAQLITLSTLLSILTLPLFAVAAQALAG